MSEPVSFDHPAIQAHLEAQADVPDGFVKLDDGSVVKIGSHRSNNEDGNDPDPVVMHAAVVAPMIAALDIAPAATGMSVADHYRSIVARLRGWGYNIREQPGCYGRNNGIDWHYGQPVAPGKHHFVCGMNPLQSYIDGMVSMLVNGYDSTPGPVVAWFGNVNGGADLICTGPANHFGMANSAVLARVMQDQPPAGPARDVAPGNDYNANGYFTGTELQHPGDSTPWPAPLLDIAVAIAASECIEFGWSANRTTQHYESTDRKDDMSWEGGPNSRACGDDFRARVAAFIASNGKPKPPSEDIIMAITSAQQADFNNLMDAYLTPARFKALLDGTVMNPHWPNTPDAKRSLTSLLETDYVANQATWSRMATDLAVDQADLKADQADLSQQQANFNALHRLEIKAGTAPTAGPVT